MDKHFTPMERQETRVYLGRSGGFDVHGCPDAEDLAEFIKTACNAHDQLTAEIAALVAENEALHEQLSRKDEACNNTINAALMMPDPVREQLVAALREIAKANRGEGGCYYTNRNNIGIAADALKAAGVSP